LPPASVSGEKGDTPDGPPATGKAVTDDSDEDFSDLELEELMEIPVVVTASRREQKLTSVPHAMSVVTHEDIRAAGARTVADATTAGNSVLPILPRRIDPYFRWDLRAEYEFWEDRASLAIGVQNLLDKGHLHVLQRGGDAPHRLRGNAGRLRLTRHDRLLESLRQLVFLPNPDREGEATFLLSAAAPSRSRFGSDAPRES